MKLLCFLGFAAAAAAQSVDVAAAVQSIAAELQKPDFKAHNAPKEKVQEFIALGDSYTAGTGANGKGEAFGGSSYRGQHSYPMQMSQDKDQWKFVNNDENLPRFSFHAYTGDTTFLLVGEQLKQGDYSEDDKNKARGQAFGKPQLAVMSIGGNDAGLSDILNDCIYRAWLPGNCQDTLDNLDKEIEKGTLKDKLIWALYNVAGSGRDAEGATPYENFQVYALEYITFFDDALDPVCNDYTWAYWSWGTEKPKLTADLRKRLNELTTKVNAEVKKAAEYLEAMGVFFVEGLQDPYKGHRFCEPGATHDQTEAKVWFWTEYSDPNDPSEGDGPASAEAWDPAQKLLDFIFPDENIVMPADDSDKPMPWEWDGAKEKYPDFQSLLNALQTAGDDVNAAGTPWPLFRSFHPKGTAYKEHARLLFGAIADHREATDGGGGGGGGGGDNQPEQGLKCAGTGTNTFMGRDDMKDKLEKFCAEAAAQGVQDKDSGSIMRKYNGGARWEVDISMDWPPGTDIKQDMEAKCKDKMSTIMDSCDGNDPKNPLNWKHGGTLGDGVVKYGIYPKKDQGYKPGECSLKLHQHEDFFGNDGPGTRRDHTYHVSLLQMFGSDGTETAGRAGFKPNSGDPDPIECGDGNPFAWDAALPDKMYITPEARDDYIQFTIGSVSWSSNSADGDKRCKVGDWDTQMDPVFGEGEIPHSGSQDRDMECWFPC